MFLLFSWIFILSSIVIDFHRFLLIFIDFRRFSWCFKDFHRILWFFIDFHRFSLIFNACKACMLSALRRLYANLCSISGWLLVLWGLSWYFIDFSWSFTDFHCFSSRFAFICIGFHGFPWIFIDFHRFRGTGAYRINVQLAVSIETFARFQAGFLFSADSQCISKSFMNLHRIL